MSTWETEVAKYEFDELLHQEERIDKYRPGGYHPVAIDDTFSNDRYQIYNKLGFGGSSTVWLAHDQSTDEWVAMKILTAERSKNSRELESYQRLAKPGLSTFFVQLRDHFFHQGPNGSHLCLVTELLGPSLPRILEELSDKDRWLAPNIVLKIARQLLEAIQALHRAGLAHGDLNMNNIVFTCHRTKNNEDRMWDELVAPYCSKLVRRDGYPSSPSVPEEYVESEPWSKWPDVWPDAEFEDIKVVDLGELFSQGQEPAACVLPGECRAPEVLFEDSFDHKTDLWLAGCAIYMLVFHMFPFSAFGGYDMLVLTIMDILGDLPKEWITRWEGIQQAAEVPEPLDPERANGRRPNPLIYYGSEKFPEETLRILVPVILGLLTYKRSSRLSASEALQMLDQSPPSCQVRLQFPEPGSTLS